MEEQQKIIILERKNEMMNFYECNQLNIYFYFFTLFRKSKVETGN